MIFPSWYKGGFSDAEKAFYCLLKPYCELTNPKIILTSWRVWTKGDKPLARFYRSGGESDGVIDTSIIELEVYSEDRDLSINVSEYLRQAVLTFEGSGGVVKATGQVAESDPDFRANIVGACDHLGPEIILTEDADERVVFSAFRLKLRKPRGLPDYDGQRRQILDP